MSSEYGEEAPAPMLSAENGVVRRWRHAPTPFAENGLVRRWRHERREKRSRMPNEVVATEARTSLLCGVIDAKMVVSDEPVRDTTHLIVLGPTRHKHHTVLGP